MLIQPAGVMRTPLLLLDDYRNLLYCVMPSTPCVLCPAETENPRLAMEQALCTHNANRRTMNGIGNDASMRWLGGGWMRRVRVRAAERANGGNGE